MQNCHSNFKLQVNSPPQITCFVSLIALDMARQENNRYDILCCVRASKKDLPEPDSGAGEGFLYKVNYDKIIINYD